MQHSTSCTMRWSWRPEGRDIPSGACSEESPRRRIGSTWPDNGPLIKAGLRVSSHGRYSPWKGTGESGSEFSIQQANTTQGIRGSPVWKASARIQETDLHLMSGGFSQPPNWFLDFTLHPRPEEKPSQRLLHPTVHQGPPPAIRSPTALGWSTRPSTLALFHVPHAFLQALQRLFHLRSLFWPTPADPLGVGWAVSCPQSFSNSLSWVGDPPLCAPFVALG